MRILVTGHRGFVGKHLVDVLSRHGAKWDGLDWAVHPDLDIAKCAMPRIYDKVFHLAAQTDAQSADAVRDAETNVLGTVRVLEAYGDKVVFASSSMVNYAQSPYAISKIAGEAYCRYYGAAIVRFCNLYGPGGHSVWDKFRDGERMVINGNGHQVRSYACVSDAVQALLRAKKGSFEILPGTRYTVNEIAKMYPNKPITHVAPRANDPFYAPQLQASSGSSPGPGS